MQKQRLDAHLVMAGQAPTRSQAASMIRLGDVKVNGRTATKPGLFVHPSDKVQVAERQRYVSRAGLKLASVADLLKINFAGKVVLDVGSSTGGFTDFALQQGAQKVMAVDVGTDQLHPNLRGDARIELCEKTDIRDVISPASKTMRPVGSVVRLSAVPQIVVIDVSFISLREILPHLADNIINQDTQVVAMVKPQFEAGRGQVNKGVIKNDTVRRQILQDFEFWAKQLFAIKDKHDSQVAGVKGNRERFYLLTQLMGS